MNTIQQYNVYIYGILYHIKNNIYSIKKRHIRIESNRIEIIRQSASVRVPTTSIRFDSIRSSHSNADIFQPPAEPPAVDAFLLLLQQKNLLFCTSTTYVLLLLLCIIYYLMMK